MGIGTGVAHAQTVLSGTSYVQMYGLIGTYVDRSQLSTTPKSAIQLGGGGLTTSYWGLRGGEDLGGGNKVVFVLESFFRPNTGQMGRNATDGLFSRNAYVGVETRYGTLRLGEQTTSLYENQIALNPFGSSVVFSPLIVQSRTATYDNTVIGDTVWANVVRYISPVYAGLTGSVSYGVSSVAGHQGRDNVGLSLNYRNGPLFVSLSMQHDRVSAVAPSSGQTVYLAGATYKTRFAKLYGAFQSTSNAGVETGSHTWELGLSVPVTATSAVLAEWARTKHSAPLGESDIRNTGSLAYDYFLSKRTDVYAVYSYDKLSDHPSGNSYGVGIRHKF